MLMIGFIFLHDRDLSVCQTHFALEEAAPDFQAIWNRLRAHIDFALLALFCPAFYATKIA